MKDGRPFVMAGLWSDAPEPATGEVTDSYAVIITDANAAMRVHDRMPVILGTDAAPRGHALHPGAWTVLKPGFRDRRGTALTCQEALAHLRAIFAPGTVHRRGGGRLLAELSVYLGYDLEAPE